MKTFTIDSNDNITVFSPEEKPGESQEGTERFHSEPQLASLAAQWPGSRLIEVWNSLPGVQPVKKFTNRKTAITRIWKAIQGLEPGAAKPEARLGRKQPRSGKQKRAGRAAGEHTKAARVIALLEQPAGASLKAIMSATGWQAHSVRGFISGQLGKKLGLRVKSFQRDGERVYAIRRQTKRLQTTLLFFASRAGCPGSLFVPCLDWRSR